MVIRSYEIPYRSLERKSRGTKIKHHGTSTRYRYLLLGYFDAVFEFISRQVIDNMCFGSSLVFVFFFDAFFNKDKPRIFHVKITS